MADPSPAEVVSRYFDAVRAADMTALGTLFAEDAVLVQSTGTREGRAAILDFYARIFSVMSLDPRPGPRVVDGDRVAVEIDLPTGATMTEIADFFTVTETRIARLAIYSGPSR